ncbi:hypothetical protein AKO1_010760 [Acrasis kona]|uniref:Uncharacterized protein n=1 Tax=Acrasis kona TaxID=1008807 RepID=A0AAW2YQZ6_9EUKA
MSLEYVLQLGCFFKNDHILQIAHLLTSHFPLTVEEAYEYILRGAIMTGEREYINKMIAKMKMEITENNIKTRAKKYGVDYFSMMRGNISAIDAFCAIRLVIRNKKSAKLVRSLDEFELLQLIILVSDYFVFDATLCSNQIIFILDNKKMAFSVGYSHKVAMIVIGSEIPNVLNRFSRVNFEREQLKALVEEIVQTKSVMMLQECIDTFGIHTIWEFLQEDIFKDGNENFIPSILRMGPELHVYIGSIVGFGFDFKNTKAIHALLRLDVQNVILSDTIRHFVLKNIERWLTEGNLRNFAELLNTMDKDFAIPIIRQTSVILEKSLAESRKQWFRYGAEGNIKQALLYLYDKLLLIEEDISTTISYLSDIDEDFTLSRHLKRKISTGEAQYVQSFFLDNPSMQKMLSINTRWQKATWSILKYGLRAETEDLQTCDIIKIICMIANKYQIEDKELFQQALTVAKQIRDHSTSRPARDIAEYLCKRSLNDLIQD